MKLAGRDGTVTDLRELIDAVIGRQDAWLFLEGDQGIELRPAEERRPDDPQYRCGRIFWADGELKWAWIGDAVVRIVYAGEEDPPHGLEALDVAGPDPADLEARPVSRLMAGLQQVDLGGRMQPPSGDGEMVALRVVEYVDDLDQPQFERLSGLAVEPPGKGG